MSGTGIDHDLLWSQVQRCNYLATYIQLIYTIYVITILNIIYIYLFTAVVLWESIVRLAFTKFIKKKKNNLLLLHGVENLQSNMLCRSE